MRALGFDDGHMTISRVRLSRFDARAAGAAMTPVEVAGDGILSWDAMTDFLDAASERPLVLAALRLGRGSALLVVAGRAEDPRSLRGPLGLDDSFACRPASWSSLSERDVIRALFATLGSSEGRANLSGELLVTRPSFRYPEGSDEPDELWAVSVGVSPARGLSLSVATFTNAALRGQIRFARRPFESYPLYRLGPQGLSRIPRGAERGPDGRAYVRRTRLPQFRPDYRERNVLSFLDFSTRENVGKSDFLDSKVGILQEVMSQLDMLHGAYAEISFESLDTSRRLLSRGVPDPFSLPRTPRPIRVERLDPTVDERLARELATWLLENGADVRDDSPFSLSLVREARSYESRGMADPYGTGHAVATQHITVESLLPRRERRWRAVVTSSVKELAVKADVATGRMTLPAKMPSCELTLCAAAQVGEGEDEKGADLVDVVTIRPSGELLFSSVDPNLAPPTLIELVEASLVRDPAGGRLISVCSLTDGENVNWICETGLFTVPDDIRSLSSKIVSYGQGTEHGPRSAQGGMPDYQSLLGIGVAPDADGGALYYCGYSKKNDKSLPTSCNLRRLVAEPGSRLMDDELMSLLCVDFVRLGQLTVVPWPLKYLREWRAMGRPASGSAGLAGRPAPIRS